MYVGLGRISPRQVQLHHQVKPGVSNSNCLCVVKSETCERCWSFHQFYTSRRSSVAIRIVSAPYIGLRYGWSIWRKVYRCRRLLLQLTSVCGAGKLDGRLTQRDLLTSQHIAAKACSQHINWTELTCNLSTQLHFAFICHARQRHDLIGCSETRTVGAQSVRVLHKHSH